MKTNKFAPVLLAVIILISLPCCGKAEEQPEAPAVTAAEIAVDTTAVIKSMINAYDPDMKTQSSEYTDLAAQLRSADEDLAECWESILEYWRFTHSDMQINSGSLPEGLPQNDSLAIVVLGFELNSDGTMQDELVGRLETAIACAEQYPNAYVICTGGGTAANNPEVTEAGLMGQWLCDAGLEESRLIIEDKSLSTVENAVFTRKILGAQYTQVDSVAIVSSSYHISWGSLLFEAVFMKTAAEDGSDEIHVVSNAAFQTENSKYRDVTRYERNGLMQIAGMS